MNIQTAKELAYEAIDRLRNAGIKVSVERSRSSDIPSTVTKYDIEGRLPPDQWNHVTFFPDNPEEADLIYAELKSLSAEGIAFDMGGCKGERDWELDWSFHIAAADNVGAAEKDTVEKIIQSM